MTGSSLVLQFISIPDERYDEYRLSSGFIKEYIFPGGSHTSTYCLHSMRIIRGHYPGPYYYITLVGDLQFSFRHLNLRSRPTWKMAVTASPYEHQSRGRSAEKGKCRATGEARRRNSFRQSHESKRSGL